MAAVKRNIGENGDIFDDKTVADKSSPSPTTMEEQTGILHYDIQLTKMLAVSATRTSSLGHLRPLMKALEISCHGIPWFLGTFIAIILMHSVDDQQILVNLFTAQVLDLIVVVIVKGLARRRRPVHNKMDMFMTVSVDKFSFPSGHMTRAATVTYFFIVHFLSGPVLRTMMVLWAVCVGMSRIMLGRHHVSDVVIGGIIGILQYRVIEYFWLSSETCQYLLLPIHEALF